MNCPKFYLFFNTQRVVLTLSGALVQRSVFRLYRGKKIQVLTILLKNRQQIVHRCTWVVNILCTDEHALPLMSPSLVFCIRNVIRSTFTAYIPYVAINLALHHISVALAISRTCNLFHSFMNTLSFPMNLEAIFTAQIGATGVCWSLSQFASKYLWPLKTDANFKSDVMASQKMAAM